MKTLHIIYCRIVVTKEITHLQHLVTTDPVFKMWYWFVFSWKHRCNLSEVLCFCCSSWFTFASSYSLMYALAFTSFVPYVMLVSSVCCFYLHTFYSCIIYTYSPSLYTSPAVSFTATYHLYIHHQLHHLHLFSISVYFTSCIIYSFIISFTTHIGCISNAKCFTI